MKLGELLNNKDINRRGTVKVDPNHTIADTIIMETGHGIQLTPSSSSNYLHDNNESKEIDEA